MIWAQSYFSAEFREQLGKATLYVAIGLFVVHLLLTVMAPWLPFLAHWNMVSHPIQAIYTPFSILLIYEAYLLIYYLRQSTTIYIGKQYEIMTLIVIRSIFKDLSHSDFSSYSVAQLVHLELMWDLLTVFVVFGLIFLFYRISGMYAPKKVEKAEEKLIGPKLQGFIQAKESLSVALLGVFVVLGLYSLTTWVLASVGHASAMALDLNHIFFDTFYTFLIMSDVCILLFSLLYTDEFPVIIRNSSFVVSTILLKLSFTAQPGMAQILLVIGIGFGVVMLWFSDAFDRLYSAGK